MILLEYMRVAILKHYDTWQKSRQ